jgi:hypothetical protein
MTIQEHSNPKPNLSDYKTDQNKILEKIGKISASNVKIKILSQAFKKQTIVEIEKSFDRWVEQLQVKIKEDLKMWSSEYSPFNNLDKLVKYYYSRFSRCVYTELRKWVNEHFESAIKLYAEHTYDQIQSEFNTIDSMTTGTLGEPLFIESHCREKSRYNYQLYVPEGTSHYGGNINSFKFLRKDAIKNRIAEVGYEKIKPTLQKAKVNVINWFENEISSGIMNCADDSFTCAISQYESIFESLNRQIDNN